MNDLVHVPDGKAFPPKGRVLLTTVSLVSEVRVIDMVLDFFDDDTEALPEERILGNTPKDELRQVNLRLMDDSKQIAIVVGLRRLGHTVAERGAGAVVEQIYEGVPAERQLRPGDVIVGVDNRPTMLIQEVQAGIKAHQPGDTVRLDVEGADGKKRIEEVELVPRPDDGTALLGVTLRTKNLRFDFPFPIDIDSLGIGGPSAGLAYSLAVIDNLTPGELTGGKRVAVTGTIESDGRVGDVGGVAQKTAAVRAAGADVFLVPAGEFEEAKARAGSKLKVVKVGTLEDALQALGRLGGNVAALGKPAGS